MCLLSQAPWYFSRTNGDPHRSGFKFQTAVISVLYVMFQVHLLCSESVEYFPAMASKFAFKRFVTIPVAQVSTGITIHCIATSTSMNVFYLFWFYLLYLLYLLNTEIAIIIIIITRNAFSFLKIVDFTSLTRFFCDTVPCFPERRVFFRFYFCSSDVHPRAMSSSMYYPY
jgi:hypothetical protein